jgi:hypothetical protein
MENLRAAWSDDTAHCHVRKPPDNPNAASATFTPL